MTSEIESAFEDAYAIGNANVWTIELARRHCLNMTFTKWEGGGQGMAEQLSGLPIDTRQVSCPIARGNSAAMRLDWVASEFYERHCVGCQHRRPTGELPNLASVMEERKAAAAAAAEAERLATERRHHEWEVRAERRRALAIAANPAMSGALRDIGILDSEPGTDSEPQVTSGALGRLVALAERAPETFTADVMDHTVQLVEHVNITALMAPLRRLARSRDSIARAVLAAALAVLRHAPEIEAGRCITDLRSHLEAPDLDADVVAALVFLAGAPDDDLPFRRFRRITDSRDPSGLRVAASTTPGTVVSVLREMLPGPAQPSSLIVAPGTVPRAVRTAAGDFERICAATAVCALATSHPEVAVQLAAPLIRNLAVDSEDSFERIPLASVQHGLATMIVLDLGDTVTQLEAAGRSTSPELRQRLFGVYQGTGRLLDPGDRWREPGDPQPDAERRQSIFRQLLACCLAHAAGDWGDHVRYEAANLADELADMEPGWAFENLDGFLGTFLVEVAQLVAVPSLSPLLVPGGEPPQMRALEAFSRRNSISSAARELLSCAEKVARVDPVATCSAIVAMITAERDADHGPEAVWRLLPLLGRIGQHYGAQTGVLARILPTLHTYLVDAEAALRAAALRAWADIGGSHQLPSSVADLLPALLTDTHIGVIRAVLAAARALTWSPEAKARLCAYAYGICAVIDAEAQAEVLKEAMTTLDVLASGDDRLRPHAEQLILRRAADLDGYDLRDALRRRWSPEIEHSADMAALRLRQTRDPRINDRFNSRDDAELCALLECGAGLATLAAQDLLAAAIELAPNLLIGCAEFAEVAWRAGRPADAMAIMRAVADTIPRQPAYDSHRALAQLLHDAASFDAAAMSGTEVPEAALRLAAAVRAVNADASSVEARLLRQVRARATARFILIGGEPPADLIIQDLGPYDPGDDPADAARRRADHLALAAARLEAESQRATITASYMRIFAGLCDVTARLLRFDAAELDADIDQASAHKTAATRRAAHLATELAKRFAPDDPLASALASALATVKGIKSEEISSVLASWAALPMPVLVVDGPQRFRLPGGNPAKESKTPARPADRDVAVVLASIDDQLITGPQVLRPGVVYELRIEVRPGQWPEWADRLDGELISHLTSQETETPTFSWPRPVMPEPDEILIGQGTLILRFGLGAGRPAPPFLVALRWRGSRDGQPITQAVDVAGHRELRLRPFDASRDFLTDFPVFDERLLTLYESLHGAGYDEDQLQAFCRLFTAICRAGLKIMWDPRYKRGTSVKEKEFHDDLYRRLQGEPELGGRLERGSRLAHGFLDVRHDGITAELKVERRVAVSEATAPKYMGQPTQYAAADGARLSILCVLDMSVKSSPVGVPENYMFTLQPALHGLANPEAPSLVAVIVINGNSPTPSSWSRRKTAIQAGHRQTGGHTTLGPPSGAEAAAHGGS